MIFEEHVSLNYNYRNRYFWAEGYFVGTVGANKNTIKKYIQEQETEDRLLDKISLKEYKDRFAGNWGWKRRLAYLKSQRQFNYLPLRLFMFSSYLFALSSKL